MTLSRMVLTSCKTELTLKIEIAITPVQTKLVLVFLRLLSLGSVHLRPLLFPQLYQRMPVLDSLKIGPSSQRAWFQRFLVSLLSIVGSSLTRSFVSRNARPHLSSQLQSRPNAYSLLGPSTLALKPFVKTAVHFTIAAWLVNRRLGMSWRMRTELDKLAASTQLTHSQSTEIQRRWSTHKSETTQRSQSRRDTGIHQTA